MWRPWISKFICETKTGAEICTSTPLRQTCMQWLYWFVIYCKNCEDKNERQRCNINSLNTSLLQRQLQYFGKLARLPSNSVLRATIFAQGSMNLQTSAHRKRGRPRMWWNTEIHKHALAIAGSSANLPEIIADPLSWKKLVREYTGKFGTETTC